MSSELCISVTACLERGEKRLPIIFNRKVNKNWKNDYICNPYLTMMNHRKHEGDIYRKAIGGFETRGKPRFHGDWFE